MLHCYIMESLHLSGDLHKDPEAAFEVLRIFLATTAIMLLNFSVNWQTMMYITLKICFGGDYYYLFFWLMSVTY